MDYTNHPWRQFTIRTHTDLTATLQPYSTQEDLRARKKKYFTRSNHLGEYRGIRIERWKQRGFRRNSLAAELERRVAYHTPIFFFFFFHFRVNTVYVCISYLSLFAFFMKCIISENFNNTVFQKHNVQS